MPLPTHSYWPDRKLSVHITVFFSCCLPMYRTTTLCSPHFRAVRNQFSRKYFELHLLNGKHFLEYTIGKNFFTADEFNQPVFRYVIPCVTINIFGFGFHVIVVRVYVTFCSYFFKNSLHLILKFDCHSHDIFLPFLHFPLWLTTIPTFLHPLLTVVPS